MRAGLIIVGVVLIGLGLWVTLGNGSYSKTDTVASIGSAKIEATHDKAIPQWVGIAGIVIGGIVAVAGIARKR
ncbi:hypothetical protein SAMN02800694_3479 [Luteibacter sp. UNCMF331Sha3.1]|uniref:hypothetical protein n=1 Tax=Luteibacter sp. UNCMF331Sha3.1 TaxID=1502760 RepID=UPI0008B20A9D|nr:hypothetical protein [Luteibacter sp. UNCMF331Sha3.1]SEN43537.1 hypothetical protein SAMN02800694_3479 [Luteibacter sp. UNCMF331Sha3.1]